MLAASMPRLKAMKQLEEVDAGRLKLHPDSLFDLVMEATGSEKLANAYRVAAVKSTWKQR